MIPGRDADCTRCKLHSTAEYVCLLGSGKWPNDVMLIGEAPGHREDETGTPFVGKAGKYLDEVLEDIGLPRKSIFITNAVSCRPPDNRKPSKKEIAACGHWLQHQIKKVKPKFILLMGNVPLLAITGKEGITKARGKPFEKDGIMYFPTYHPSYILRNDYKDDTIFRNDLRVFKTLVEGGGLPEEKGLNIRVVKTERDFEAMLRDMIGRVSVDIEGTGLYPWALHRPDELPKKWKKKPPDPRSYTARSTSIGFGTRKHQWIMVQDEFPLKRHHCDRIEKRLRECYVVGHYAKFDSLWLLVLHGLSIDIDFDTGIAHYMVDENSRHDLKGLAQRLCNAPNWDVDNAIKHGQGSRERLIKYHAHDLFYTRKLSFIIARDLNADPAVAQVYYKIMQPLTRIFRDGEFEGAFINQSRMADVEKDLRKKIVECEKKLLKWSKDISWSSPSQVAEVLFKKLKIEPITIGKPNKKWPDGAPSTAEPVLKQLDHPCVKDLMDLRGAKQQLSFFIEGWKPYIVNDRIHPSFKLTGTVTGRLSCEHPNLQQVPRDPTIRTLITAPPGWVLVEADLSQIELRIAAELAGERALIEAFARGLDPHWMTAMNELRRGGGERNRVLKTAWKLANRRIKSFDEAIDILLEAGADSCIAIDFAWKELRKKAKAINFGYLYGMGWRKFKQYAREKYDIILTDEQAQESRTSYFALYRDLPAWHRRQRRFANRNGYVRCLSGRKRRLPDAMSDEDNVFKGEAERQAINSPVQGFANELNLMSIIQLSQEFSRDVYRPFATVHDSILSYVRVDWAERVCARTKEVMSHPKLLDEFDIQLKIPIEAEVTVGDWGKGKKWQSGMFSTRARPNARRGGRANTSTSSGTSRSSGKRSRRDRSRLAA